MRKYEPYLLYSHDTTHGIDFKIEGIVTEQVVIACSEKQARTIASKNAGNEGRLKWTNPEHTQCVKIGLNRPKCVYAYEIDIV
jgi:hypothetical protein